jgi:hypothetical protein
MAYAQAGECPRMDYDHDSRLPRVHFADWELPHWVELLAD